jgi:acetolactate synthase-1/2/3 large subunit
MLGGHLLVKSLAKHGTSRVFTVAGESYLPVLDGFLEYPEIDVITCRHESGASFMAEADANLTGEPGIAFVTRGPGACNGSIGVHTARQSSTPMIFFSGLIGIEDRDKEAFQEFDIAQMFGPLAKWATVIEQAGRISEYVARAYHIATSDRPGPVVLGLPEEVVFEQIESTDKIKTPLIPPHEISPSPQDLKSLETFLSEAQRPLIITGGGGWSDRACADLSDFAGTNHIPVATSFRRQDLFNHNDGNYIGELGSGPNPTLIERVKNADRILVLGARLNEMATQIYTLFEDHQKIAHIHPGADTFGQSVMPDLIIRAHMRAICAALAVNMRLDGRRWAAWRDEGRHAYLNWSTIEPAKSSRWQGADMTQIFAHLQEALPQDSIVATDAGNFSGWCQRYLKYGRPGRKLAPISGAMGYAVPSVIAASLRHKDKICVGFCGDGGFQMSGQELATAMHHGATPIIVVCNNNMYGTIRMHQEREYPGRISATGLTNPDFAKLAEAYGAFSAVVENEKDFPGIWAKAVNATKQDGLPALIEIRMDPKQISTQA